jgi:hypothetical protein
MPEPDPSNPPPPPGGEPTDTGITTSAFVHDKVWHSECDVSGNCEPKRLRPRDQLRAERQQDLARAAEAARDRGERRGLCRDRRPPDYNAPLTAADLSAGRDPGVDKALELLKA